MDFYSMTLGLALGAAVAARALALTGLRAPGRRRPAAVLGLLALALVAASGLSHRLEGHAAGSPSALAPAAFLLEHPALSVAVGLAVAALVLVGLARAGGPRE
jgi:hypothetical protein